jgi:hypothetical protein
MINTELLKFLNSVLGESKHTSKYNYSFVSPFISSSKHKLEIDLDINSQGNVWHCWVSNKKGGNIYSLLKEVNKLHLYTDKLKSIINDNTEYKYLSINKEEKKKVDFVQLPKEYLELKDLLDSKNLIIRHALSYLIKRGITYNDIVRYKMGVCLSGKYENRILIPSYDSNFKLNYFVARNIFSDTMKYLNPPLSQNCIVFESFLNTNMPLIIVEGIFDAIRIENNSIPIMGKIISKVLCHKISQMDNNDIYIALDRDAIDNAYKIAEKIIHFNNNVYIVKLGVDDPADLGKEGFKPFLQKSKLVTEETLMKYKLSRV